MEPQPSIGSDESVIGTSWMTPIEAAGAEFIDDAPCLKGQSGLAQFLPYRQGALTMDLLATILVGGWVNGQAGL